LSEFKNGLFGAACQPLQPLTEQQFHPASDMAKNARAFSGVC